MTQMFLFSQLCPLKKKNTCTSTLHFVIFHTCILILLLHITCLYSRTCFGRPPLQHTKSGLSRQVVSHSRSSYITVTNDPSLELWSLKTGGLPRQRSPKTGSTVYIYIHTYYTCVQVHVPLHVLLSTVVHFNGTKVKCGRKRL